MGRIDLRDIADRPVDVVPPQSAAAGRYEAIGAGAARRGVPCRHSARLGCESPGLWTAEGLEAAAPRGTPGRPLHGRAVDAGDGPARREPWPGVGDHHPGGHAGRPAGRSRRSPVSRRLVHATGTVKLTPTTAHVGRCRGVGRVKPLPRRSIQRTRACAGVDVAGANARDGDDDNGLVITMNSSPPTRKRIAC